VQGGICGQRGNGTDVSPITLILPCRYHATNAPIHIFIPLSSEGQAGETWKPFEEKQFFSLQVVNSSKKVMLKQ
jgi:hypothetical protein